MVVYLENEINATQCVSKRVLYIRTRNALHTSPKRKTVMFNPVVTVHCFPLASKPFRVSGEIKTVGNCKVSVEARKKKETEVREEKLVGYVS